MQYDRNNVKYLLTVQNCSANAERLISEDQLTCTCKGGLYGNGFVCVGKFLHGSNSTLLMSSSFIDYDECLSENHNCSSNAKCTNTFGGFECACFEDYFGDGMACLGKFSLQ